MADKKLKSPGNAPGFYYVDNTCIDCDLCRGVAPDIFKRNEEGGYTVVDRQPITPQEIALAEEGLSSCPTDSIGNDGAD